MIALNEYIKESLLDDEDELVSKDLDPFKDLLLAKDENEFRNNSELLKSISKEVVKTIYPHNSLNKNDIIFKVSELSPGYRNIPMVSIGFPDKPHYCISYKGFVSVERGGTEINHMMRLHSGDNDKFYILPQMYVKIFKGLFKQKTFGGRVIKEYFNKKK